ncbi:hypothetical protein Pcinc_028303 [Petrolisthes cinctipes]|uniref:Uncharacterized protein n=1 Tax=Petrolisthes cinctipes TaxID=88211 RepID=A0AAE1F2M1_PETCI|nr:hypothetical protein Pcinc_028303 [Petrolisthes cinctipes]
MVLRGPLLASSDGLTLECLCVILLSFRRAGRSRARKKSYLRRAAPISSQPSYSQSEAKAQRAIRILDTKANQKPGHIANQKPRPQRLIRSLDTKANQKQGYRATKKLVLKANRKLVLKANQKSGHKANLKPIHSQSEARTQSDSEAS